MFITFSLITILIVYGSLVLLAEIVNKMKVFTKFTTFSRHQKEAVSETSSYILKSNNPFVFPSNDLFYSSIKGRDGVNTPDGPISNEDYLSLSNEKIYIGEPKIFIFCTGKNLFLFRAF